MRPARLPPGLRRKRGPAPVVIPDVDRGRGPEEQLAPFAMLCLAFGKRQDVVASGVFEDFVGHHLSWRTDAPGSAQLTSLLSSPEVAPSHGWIVPIGSVEGAVEAGWGLERSLTDEGSGWLVNRHVLQLRTTTGSAAPGPGLCRMVLVRGAAEAVGALARPVGAWWGALEGWPGFRGAALYEDTEGLKSNIALEVAWLDAGADLQAVEEAAERVLGPSTERLLLTRWHFRVSALHPTPQGDRSTIESTGR